MHFFSQLDRPQPNCQELVRADSNWASNGSEGCEWPYESVKDRNWQFMTVNVAINGLELP